MVDVAVEPIFPRLDALDQRMPTGPKVAGRMLVLRLVAAADVPAAEASTQMNPAVSEGDALVTDVRRRLDDDH